MNRPRRWDFIYSEYRWEEPEFGETPKGNYVLMEDYVALERRHQDLLDAIERTGGLDNIRRVEVSQPVVIDMARENAFLKGENARLRHAGDRMAAALNGEYNHELPCVADWNAAKGDNL